MKELDKTYNPKEFESKWYKRWEENGSFESKGEGEPFSIVIPPPNITAALHVGHALNLVLQDICTRFKRMQGHKVLWVPGEDHAGIATQNAVEKDLLNSGTSKEDLGREAFLNRAWKWSEEYRQMISSQIRAIGCSCDWSKERFTLDEELNVAVRKAFVLLYDEGLIYRGKYIVNWCSRCGTVLSDEEVEYIEIRGKLYHIRYPLKNNEGSLVIATTRPETMLADTAVAVHPSDERYRELVGRVAVLPLMNRELPIIADHYVDPSFGTGALKVTPAHDTNDFLIGLRHKLPVIEVIDKTARINENGGAYASLTREEARKRVVEDLYKQGLLAKIEDYDHSVGTCYRCASVVEPLLSDQWFVKTRPIADKAIEAVEDGEIVFFPHRWKKVYLNWMNDIRDWCISRQLWWGHRIPVWYCDDCEEMIVSENDPSQCPACSSRKLRQDEDVLDTWFSSQLWPFSVFGWPKETAELKEFYPTSVLITAFDIIFFWVARMIMAGYHFTGKKPFADVYIHQLVRDSQGRKMSKSLGNGIDPFDVIDEYGCDAMRFTLAMLAAQGRDINLDPRLFDTYKRFANKIWNAARFALMNLDDDVPGGFDEERLMLEDRWILSRASRTNISITSYLETYEFNLAAKELYGFFWNEFCDWYIESIKTRLKDDSTRGDAQRVLLSVIDHSLRLLHPFMPFITEEIWEKLPGERGFLIDQEWSRHEGLLVDSDAETEFEIVVNIVKGIRNVKSEMNIPPSVSVAATYVGNRLDDNSKRLIRELSGASDFMPAGKKPEQSVTAYADETLLVYVKLPDIDLETEMMRLEQKSSKLAEDVAHFEKKLTNKSFLEKAPESVVSETRDKLSSASQNLDRIRALIEDLKQNG
ncbi:MAG: Valine--tRNA ligase [Thermotogales bacterium 46_20]|nr:MAG: Valine--tRNA ligase [Thermotogales bacterium 46_20]